MPKDKKNIVETIMKAENTDFDGKMYSGNIFSRRSKTSSGVGAMQFLKFWHPLIEKYALKEGYTYNNIDDFINNSTLQLDFGDYYVENYMKPEINKLKSQVKSAENLTDEQLQLLYHKLGAPTLKNVIETKSYDQTIHDISPNDYLKRGGVDPVVFEKKEEPTEKPVNEYLNQTYYTAESDATRVSDSLIPLSLEGEEIKVNFQEGGKFVETNVWDEERQDSVPGKKWTPDSMLGDVVGGKTYGKIQRSEKDTSSLGVWSDEKQQYMVVENKTSYIDPTPVTWEEAVKQWESEWKKKLPKESTELFTHGKRYKKPVKEKPIKLETKQQGQIENKLISLELKDELKIPGKVKYTKPFRRQYKEEDGKYFMKFLDTKSGKKDWRPITKRTYELGIQATDEDLNFRPHYQEDGGLIKLVL